MLHLNSDHSEIETKRTFRKMPRVRPLFVFTVLIPTFLAIVYFGLITSDVYISESHYLVRSPDKKQMPGITALFSGASVSPGDDIYAVEEYINSRDALQDLNKDKLVTRAYSRPEIDIFNRFGTFLDGTSDEDLFRYFKSRVSASFDAGKSVTMLKVRAYTPEDAYRMNERLLELGEGLVNRLNQRSRGDLIRYAEKEVSNAKDNATRSAQALSRYRNQLGVVDPEKQATVQIQLISKLQDELIATQTQLDQLRSFTPDNPQVAVARERLSSLRREINSETNKIAGGRESLAGAAEGYERVYVENEFSTKQLSASMVSLEDAKNEARRQQIYIERIVQPSKPDDSTEPKRFRGIAATFVLGLIIYGILSLLFAGVKEHQHT